MTWGPHKELETQRNAKPKCFMYVIKQREASMSQ